MMTYEQNVGRWPSKPNDEPEEVTLATGERARVQYRDGVEGIEVVNARGDLIFAYDPVRKVTRLAVPDGDLELVTTRGNISLCAAGEVAVKGGGKVAIEGEHLRLAGARGELELDTVTYAGRRLRATVGEAQLAFGKLRVFADTVRERARNVYRTIDGLAHTTAGKMRTYVDGSVHLFSEDVSLKARRDAKIDGEQILLG